MGTLRSTTDHSGMVVNGLTLGAAARDYSDDEQLIADSDYRWDHSRLPSGVINDDGTITVDEPEDI